MPTKQKVMGAEQNLFPYVDEVRALDEADMACLTEVRDVLARHARLDRFGISLLHKHFDLGEDECLVEETDVENRCQVVSVKWRSDMPRERVLETAWQLGETPNVIQSCNKECYISYEGKHTRGHVKRSGG